MNRSVIAGALTGALLVFASGVHAQSKQGMSLPDDIDPESPPFVDGLGLDSIDALELGVAIQKRYGIVLSANSEETRRHFASVRALSEMIDRNRTK